MAQPDSAGDAPHYDAGDVAWFSLLCVVTRSTPSVLCVQLLDKDTPRHDVRDVAWFSLLCAVTRSTPSVLCVQHLDKDTPRHDARGVAWFSFVLCSNLIDSFCSVCSGSGQGVAQPDGAGDAPHRDAGDVALHAETATQQQEPYLPGGWEGGSWWRLCLSETDRCHSHGRTAQVVIGEKRERTRLLKAWNFHGIAEDCVRDARGFGWMRSQAGWLSGRYCGIKMCEQSEVACRHYMYAEWKSIHCWKSWGCSFTNSKTEKWYLVCVMDAIVYSGQSNKEKQNMGENFCLVYLTSTVYGHAGHFS